MTDESAKRSPRTRDIWWMFLRTPFEEPRALATRDFWYLVAIAFVVTLFAPLRWIDND